MTHSTTQPGIVPVDDSPLVKLRKPVVRLDDRDRDGRGDVFCYDLDGDGDYEVEHFIADRRTLVTVDAPPPWEAPSTVTHYTGEPEEVSLRVTFRVRRLTEVTFEINGIAHPACLSSHGMLSLGLVWTADREHRDEVSAAQAFYVMNGGRGGFERA